jgi:hypothetical protein
MNVRLPYANGHLLESWLSDHDPPLLDVVVAEALVQSKIEQVPLEVRRRHSRYMARWWLHCSGEVPGLRHPILESAPVAGLPDRPEARRVA